MRRWTRYMPFLTVLLAFSLQGCQDTDGDSLPTGHESVAVKMALSVAKSVSSGTTRMVPDNLLGDAENVDLRCVIPFAVGDNEISVAAEVQPNPIIGGGSFNLAHAITNGAFFTSGCDFDPEKNINKLLAYCRDTRHSPGASRGSLVESFAPLFTTSGLQPEDYLQPKDIRFSLQPIKTREEYLGQVDDETDEPTIAEELADYLTSIANAKTSGGKTWKSDATNDNLKMLYKNFIYELTDGVGEVLPGSTADVKAWVTELKTQLNTLSLTVNSVDDQIQTAILNQIATADSKWDDAWKNFPSTLGLPDGAAVVRWQSVTEGNETVEKFVPETQTTTIANINNIDRFTYPAEIYYYGNSPTMVSETKDLSAIRDENITKWKTEDAGTGDAVLDNEFAAGPVTAATRAVAMKDPLQYAVAQLQVMLKKTESAKLLDANATEVSVGTKNFKLTGVIVGGQLPVGFDFRPETVYPLYSEADMKFIYDNQVKTNSTDDKFFYLSPNADATGPSTLVLQSYDEKNVKLVFEFEYVDNEDANIDKFKGLNGYVYEGTKFYLVGEIAYDGEGKVTPADLPEGAGNRVFTQDRTTTVNVKVKDLKKAYNVLPNLLSPRLEMGIELTPQWEQATTTDVIL